MNCARWHRSGQPLRWRREVSRPSQRLELSNSSGTPRRDPQPPATRTTATLRCRENPGKSDPRDYLKPARVAAKRICLARYEAFGCAGQASKIKVITLEKIAERYARGELNQIVN